jgi:hypothetical protein
MKDSVRIGCGAGFWGDSPEGPAQLVRLGDIDYLVLDYLAEITMSILARAKERKPQLGYATDFVTQVIGPLAPEIARRGIKVVANAGGCNPVECCNALQRELEKQGVRLRVAAVLGDDIRERLGEFRGQGVTEMWTGEKLPAQVQTANAYFGAFPIARALALGADIVVTGRCADSALALGPLIHEFGWRETDWDRLAAGSLAGHVIECGVQATGGYATDWKAVADDWSDMGFPIAECRPNGDFLITKPPGTGGAVNFGTVAEQVTYETGDPRRYVLPDVVCDLSQVRVTEIGPHAVAVTGVKGTAATDSYKVSATVPHGHRCLATLFVRGIDASAKARAMGEALLKRVGRILGEKGFAAFAETSIEVLGAEDTYGPHAVLRPWREVMLKVAVRHADEAALEVFSREVFPAATAMAQGIGGIFGGRPKVQPVLRLFSMLVPKSQVPACIRFEGADIPVPAFIGAPYAGVADGDADEAIAPLPAGPRKTVRLVDLAYARSGDKGDASNIAVIARKPEYLPAIATQLTARAVADYMGYLAKGTVRRYPWPGLNGFNFLLEQALGGGGVASLRYDPQGKGHAQVLLEFPIEVPTSWRVEAQ